MSRASLLSTVPELRTLDLARLDSSASLRSTVDSLAAELRRRIHGGGYAPGERLVEPALSREFGVSRGTVREAIRRLGASGLVEVELHRGARVRQFTPADVLETGALREPLEGLAAKLAAVAIGRGGDPGPLLQLQAEMDAATERGDAAAFWAVNDAYHEEIIRLAGVARLRDIIDALCIPGVRRLGMQSAPQDLRLVHVSNGEHKLITRSIAGADAAAAEVAMRFHIARSTSDAHLLIERQLAARKPRRRARR